jgi:hypothetical protein
MNRFALLIIAMLACTVGSLPQAGRIRPETSPPEFGKAAWPTSAVTFGPPEFSAV